MKPSDRLYNLVGGDPNCRKLPVKFGVEVEVEGVRAVYVDGWDTIHDGSLREGLEFVTSPPVGLAETLNRIQALCPVIAGADLTHRCSVHVHLNMLPLSLRRCVSVILGAFGLEDLLFAMAGDRSGNPFSSPLRGSIAEARLLSLAYHMEQEGSDVEYLFSEHMMTEQERYFAINTHSLMKFGTLEMRMHVGCCDAERLCMWTKALSNLYEAFRRMKISEACTFFRDVDLSKVFDRDVRHFYAEEIASIDREQSYVKAAYLLEDRKLYAKPQPKSRQQEALARMERILCAE